MRTTLDLDPDILDAARELAKLSRATLGATVSRLVRSALVAPPTTGGGSLLRNGVPVFSPRGELITCEHVRTLEADD